MAGLWLMSLFTSFTAGRTSIRGFAPSLLLAALLGLGVAGSGAASARESVPRQATTLPAIEWADLPKQGQVVYAQIHQGGPFAFAKDGTVFGNYEQRLPRQKRGYYREYTVSYNARSRSRGPRRIVCGGQEPSAPDTCYYTADHYKSFAQIKPQALRPSQRLKQP